MSNEPTTFKPENEETYEALISLIENTQGRLAPIIVGCDDEILRDQVIQRYEAEAQESNIRAYRIKLGQEPSVRAGLAQLKESEDYLQGYGEAVFTITGAEFLLWIKPHEEDEQSEIEKFFGYLQWTREGLREFPYPIVLWVPHRILRQMSQRAPDFWSWRKAVLRFVDESAAPAVRVDWEQSQQIETKSKNSFLPPLEELLEEIQQLEETSPESASLATLYNKLGEVYAWRVTHGEAGDLAQEQAAAVSAFEKAITHQKSRGDESALVVTLTRLGNFFQAQSRFTEAVTTHEQALEIARKIQDKQQESYALGNLGNAYYSLGQFQRAIDFHQQYLDIAREIGDKQGQANSLGSLGLAYYSLGQFQRAIDFHQQSLDIKRKIGDKQGEAKSLGNLGLAYNALGQFQRAIDFHQQALDLARETGDRNWEAKSLGNLGLAYNALGQFQRAITFHQQQLDIAREIGDKQGQANSLFNKALAIKSLDQTAEALEYLKQANSIYSSIQLEHMVKRCHEAIAQLTTEN
ncbi:tetratricopeptide repeat protein [filamentous cyanobacterium LEGE 11480]|uniref:Tetratricopeptide repeat protein n=1 Tax=Romeriopsis navalis LEGE 11480 TaxID=2777977 RepID=A0A928VNR2_9CYAN|nr:tetratricopeptide repeat protein [Romeriopsis navalis]MBE9031695.1 tetratricopeptide repeat protein [Romeriopsis navalis LEGE 11480]